MDDKRIYLITVISNGVEETSDAGTCESVAVRQFNDMADEFIDQPGDVVTLIETYVDGRSPLVVREDFYVSSDVTSTRLSIALKTGMMT